MLCYLIVQNDWIAESGIIIFVVMNRLEADWERTQGNWMRTNTWATKYIEG